MIKTLLKILQWLGGAFLIFLAHLLVSSSFPYPFNLINVIFLCVLFLLILEPRAHVVFIGLIVAFLNELYLPIPFGISLAAGVFSWLILYWFLLNIFTNRSVYIVFLSGIIGITLFRAAFIALLLIFAPGLKPAWNEYLVSIGVETGITAVALTVVYLAALFFTRRLRPEYIKIAKKGFIYER